MISVPTGSTEKWRETVFWMIGWNLDLHIYFPNENWLGITILDKGQVIFNKILRWFREKLGNYALIIWGKKISKFQGF